MSVSEHERLKLWVRAGGTCTICKRYLLESELTGREVTRGEFAHNVGRKASTRSPRGLHPLPETDRDTADNAILLCPTCHTEVDDLRQLDLFDVDKLFGLKQDHEAFIRDVTRRNQNSRTVVLRLRGLVRGAADDLDRNVVTNAILTNTSRFAAFPFADRFGVEIDLRGLAGEDDADPEYYRAATRKIDEVIERSLKPAIVENAVPHLSVFGFARLPLLMHLGSRLDDTLATDVYQRHRSGETWTWPAEGPTTKFAHRSDHEGTSSAEEGVLIVNASGTIHTHELPAELHALPRFVIEPTNGSPHVDSIATRESLADFEQVLRQLLAELEVTRKTIRRVHVLAAAPVSAAITLGRSIGWGIHPTIAIYDRDGDTYRLALEVTRP